MALVGGILGGIALLAGGTYFSSWYAIKDHNDTLKDAISVLDEMAEHPAFEDQKDVISEMKQKFRDNLINKENIDKYVEEKRIAREYLDNDRDDATDSLVSNVNI